MEKVKRAEAKQRQLEKKDANKNESETRKREDDKKEKMQKEADKALLKNRKKITKNKAEPKMQTKKQQKVSAAVKRLKERAEEHARKKEEKEKQVEATREALIAEGLTVRVLDDDNDTVTSEDMEWEYDQWEVVDHAVDWNTGKGNFKVIIGMRAGMTEASKMWMWGQRVTLMLDGAPEEVLDACIREKCEHRVYRDQMLPRKLTTKKKKVEMMEKPKKKKPCDHSCHDLGLSYNADPEVNPGWCAPGKFLFGVKCAGCGSPFVQKAPPAGEGSGKEPGDPQVPSTTNAVCCCNNIRNRNGTSEEGCSHAKCTPCWNEGILKASKSDDRSRASSRRGR
jgi:hypothetical protein